MFGIAIIGTTLLHLPFVLVIDDIPAQGALIAAGCRKLGFQSDHISDLRNLRVMLAHIRPAAIITEVKMPQEDGFDVMRAVAFVDPAIPLLVTSFDVERFRDAIRGVQALYDLKNVVIMPKPIWRDTLVSFLGKYSGTNVNSIAQ